MKSAFARITLTLCIAALLAAFSPSSLTVAQDGPGGEPDPPAAEAQVPSTDNLLVSLESNFHYYALLTSGVFGLPMEERYDFEALKSAVLALAREGLDLILSDSGDGDALLQCLVDVADSGVLAANLAAVAKANDNPIFLQEYFRTFCAGMLGSSYGKGKIRSTQLKLDSTKGELVVVKDGIWLTEDHGFTGNLNGYVDQGEWFTLKLGITNTAPSGAYLGALARLTLLDRKGKPCLPVSVDDGDAGLGLPEECKDALVLSEPVALPELSPGEKATVGPFDVVLNPTAVGPRELKFALLVEVADAKPSSSTIVIPLPRAPVLEASRVIIDDDQAGQSRGNGNGKIEPGERIEVKTELSTSGRGQFSRIGVAARQYSSFMEVADRRVGIGTLKAGKSRAVGGQFEFEVPSVATMAQVPADKLDRKFFIDRKTNLWLAVAGCAGALKTPSGWSTSVPQGYVCPDSSPGYQFVVPVELGIEFGQVLLISSQPPGAEILVNDVAVGTTEGEQPLVYTQLEPVRNNIVYYTVTAFLDGYETQTKELPVIWKDPAAGNLTTAISLELREKVVIAPPPDPVEPDPDPYPLPPIDATVGGTEPSEDPLVRPDPEDKPKVEQEDESGFAIFAGAAVRWFDPNLDGDVQKLSIHGPAVGFELGGAYFFTGNFFLGADFSMFFATGETPVSYRAPAAGAAAVATDNYASLDSLMFYSFALEPGFRYQFWRLILTAGMGLHLGGISAAKATEDTPTKVGSDETATGLVNLDSTVQPKPFELALRVKVGLAVDAGKGFEPYVNWFILIPNEVVDWGLSLGLGYKF